jgi:hypothetical protein
MLDRIRAIHYYYSFCALRLYQIRRVGQIANVGFYVRSRK